MAGSMEQLSGEELYRGMSETLRNRLAIKQQLATTVADLQASALENARLAATLLRNRTQTLDPRH